MFQLLAASFEASGFFCRERIEGAARLPAKAEGTG